MSFGIEIQVVNDYSTIMTKKTRRDNDACENETTTVKRKLWAMSGVTITVEVEVNARMTSR
jgi:hypothetical protein